MNQSRILPLLGPALVLYFVAAAASVGGGLSPWGMVVSVVAVLASLTPLWLRPRVDTEGARRVGSLGLASGLALVGVVKPGAMAISLDLAAVVGLAAGGALVTDLALTVPDRPERLRGLRPALILLAVAVAIVGVTSALPVFELFGEVVIVPAHFRLLPGTFCAVAIGAALLLRLARPALGSGPEALASNSWGILALLPSTIAATTLVATVQAGVIEPGSGWVQGGGAFTAVALVYGHVALVDPNRRLSAGRAVRRAVSSAVTVVLAGVVVASAPALVPDDPLPLAVGVAGVLTFGVLVYRVVQPLVRRVLAPFGARLLDAVDAATAASAEIASLESLGEAVLVPMRRASASLTADPLLFTVHPARRVRVDAAGQPHVQKGAMPGPIAERLAAEPGEPVVHFALSDKVVRRPELRGLVESLEDLSALCVVPLLAEGELEGALVVPRGTRETPPSLEELAALRRLGAHAGSLVSLLMAKERAQRREGGVTLERDRAEERVEALEEELERLRAEAKVLRRGRGAARLAAPSVSYSPAMRALERRIAEIAPLEAPIVLQAEGGVPVDQIARAIHGASSRADGPFIVTDCASVRPEQSMEALFGREGERPAPGWLRLAHGGTLLLADVPALSPEAQRLLAEALAVRQARAVDGPGAYPVDVRIVATSRVPLEPLHAAGAFDPELYRWLSRLTAAAPPLRERREDIPSLVLLALDRACRVLGRPAIGIEQAAVDALLEHDWPGNLRELQHVIDRAVAATQGHQVRREALPALLRLGETMGPTPEDPLAGTYAELERRILEHALLRADGNKSEAARLLGLKRTTFLDKIRRLELAGPADPEGDETAA